MRRVPQPNPLGRRTTRQNDDRHHCGSNTERHVGRLGPRRDPVRDTPSLVSRKRETLDEKLPWPAIAIK